MGLTALTTSSANAVKVWEAKTWLMAMKRAVVGHAFNRGAIHTPEELNGKDKVGDSVSFDYVGKLTKVPLGEGAILIGNEEALDIQSHSMVMNMSRVGTVSPNRGTIEQQRTNIAFDTVSQKQSANRVVELVDASFFNQLAGCNPTSMTVDGTLYANATDMAHVQGLNTIVAPTANRILRAGLVANDESLGANNTMNLALIDNLLELADANIQPLERFDDGTFDLFVSPEQLTDLQHDTSSPVQWYTAQLSILQNSARNKDNMFENSYQNNILCAGRYRDVWIYSSPRVSPGQRSDTSAVITTVKRAVLIGQNAVSFASPFGSLKKDNGVPVKYYEELQDYETKKGSEARLMYGLKKMSPSNKDDIGSIVLSTYAAAHH